MEDADVNPRRHKVLLPGAGWALDKALMLLTINKPQPTGEISLSFHLLLFAVVFLFLKIVFYYWSIIAF